QPEPRPQPAPDEIERSGLCRPVLIGRSRGEQDADHLLAVFGPVCGRVARQQSAVPAFKRVLRWIELCERARASAERLERPDLLSYALNALGYGLVLDGREGISIVEEALCIALGADLPELAGRAYFSLVELGITVQQFDLSDRYYTEGMAYCEEPGWPVLQHESRYRPVQRRLITSGNYVPDPGNFLTYSVIFLLVFF
ncbi:MAG TPA: hypothetical protein VF979_12695, partial [Streptosporangiaceae bacterium]